jgi:hypothetical protein
LKKRLKNEYDYVLNIVVLSTNDRKLEGGKAREGTKEGRRNEPFISSSKYVLHHIYLFYNICNIGYL